MNNEAIPHARDALGDDSTQVFMNQLLLALVISKGGTIVIPVHEVDATGGYIMTVEVDPDKRIFILHARKKQ